MCFCLGEDVAMTMSRYIMQNGKQNKDLLGKLLSHRLRGLSQFEHTPSALEWACNSNIPYLEIDARVSKDGEIYLYHDPITGNDIDGSFAFAQSCSHQVELFRFTNGQPLLSLTETLERFKRRAYQRQILCIDIKDYGFEDRYIELVRAADLEDHVYFVSWIPQTLIRLWELGARSPLILSHWNLLKLGKLGNVLTRMLKDRIVRFGNFVFMGVNKIEANLGSLSHGYQHSLICQEIPDILLEVLISSSGGIIMHFSMMGDALASYCLYHKLKLWLFSARDTRQYIRYAKNPAVDVVFCDDARAIANSLGREISLYK